METKYFFNDTADLRKYIAVTESFPFNEIENTLETSAIRYLRNDMGIGKELFDEILTGYNSGYENLSDIKKQLVHKIRSVVVKFAFSSYISVGIVNFGKDGINQLKNENRELIKKWQKDDLHQELFKQGFENLDILLEFLEEKKASFSTWTSSQAYTITKGQ
ncbi:MAG TPA: hypothetical protein PKD91_14155, partial [Bacteroidia bacterium]|nr:hypothetical protein [Bacteroidia bacterium]